MEGSLQKDLLMVSARMTTAAMLAVFLLLGLPLLVSAAEREVVINELMWGGAEYIELLNNTGEDIDLSGWSLMRQKAGKDEVKIIVWEDDEVIAAGAFYLLSESKLAGVTVDLEMALILVDQGELVRLRDNEGRIVDEANWLGLWYAGSNVGGGVSMERVGVDSDGLEAESWHTSTSEIGGRRGSPGYKNSEPIVNQAPEAVINAPTKALTGEELVFSAEDSTDPEDDKLNYEWRVGDGVVLDGERVMYSYAQPGTYQLTLVVSDGVLRDEAMREVTVVEPIYSDKIIINEYLPDPVGSDSEGEFIELKNLDHEMVDLSGWQLDDSEGGSVAYVIPKGTQIGVGEIMLFERQETKIALNNGSDKVRLMDPRGRIKAVSSYQTSKEGQSYNWVAGNQYVVSMSPTPGAENKIVSPVTEDDEVGEEEGDAEEESVKGTVAGATIKKISLSDVRQEDKGTIVEVEGSVSVPPGILGEKVAYLAGSGVQLYLFKADWPKLSLGDKVRLTGEVSSMGGETRLKLVKSDDLSVVNKGDPPKPHVIETGEVGEAVEGWLVTIQGKVTETSGDTFYVDDDSGAAKVYIKSSTKIDKPKMKKGDPVTITGVVSETSGGYRVLPRWQEDVRQGLVAGLTSFPATGGIIGWEGFLRVGVLLLDRQAWSEMGFLTI